MQLPFRDESVDKILALYSVPFYLKGTQREKMFKEIKRVLKIGGEAKFFPLFPSSDIVKILDQIFGGDQRFETANSANRDSIKDLLVISKSKTL